MAVTFTISLSQTSSPIQLSLPDGVDGDSVTESFTVGVERSIASGGMGLIDVSVSLAEVSGDVVLADGVDEGTVTLDFVITIRRSTPPPSPGGSGGAGMGAFGSFLGVNISGPTGSEIFNCNGPAIITTLTIQSLIVSSNLTLSGQTASRAALIDASKNLVSGLIDLSGASNHIGGILPLGYGGTNANTAAGARTNLDVYSKAEFDALLAAKANSGHGHTLGSPSPSTHTHGELAADGDHSHTVT